jgi:dihydroorotate dehydrogenase
MGRIETPVAGKPGMSLRSIGFQLARPLLHSMDAEAAHLATLRMLGSLPCGTSAAPGLLRVSAFGIDLPNPLGIAAGFDKNAEVPDALLGMGFGFVEVGSVTPLPQAGNPKPRLFRLAEDEAVINRMGFNNDGHQTVRRRLLARAGRPGVIGVNLGANKDSSDRAGDYVQGIETLGPLASYVTINISSPNTPGLRTLQSENELRPLLARAVEARNALRRPLPLLLKLAPDLAEEDLRIIAACCLSSGIDGAILTNTTLARPPLRSRHAAEAGGLSGAPLFDLATRQLASFHLLTGGRLPLVGAGGIGSAEQAWRKVAAGASLLQLYSALVYKGPGLVQDILSGLAARMQQAGYSTLSEAVGHASAEIAHQ